MQLPRKFAPVRIPLHDKGTPLDRISLHADMASLNPKGFRTASEKRDRHRITKHDRKRKHPRGRFKTRVEKLAELVE